MNRELPPPVQALFPACNSAGDWDDFLTRELLAAHERVIAGSVVPTFDISRFRQELSDFEFEVPLAADEVLRWTIRQLEHGVVHATSPRYFGLFNPAPAVPAQWADRITATFNPQLATRTTSPAAVEIENHVVEAVARRLGLPGKARGHFTTGGAEANFTALVCALTRANARFSRDGVRAFDGQPVIYASADCHLAWLKIAHQSGIGRSAVRLVDTDGTGRMDHVALQKATARDRMAGCIPVMVIGTCGTTNAGMIDPLPQCADIAKAADAWFHVDAAWGGALIASDQGKSVLAGIETADSITVDAHKWFATTMGCGMFLTQSSAVLSQAFQVTTTYMPSAVQNADPYMNSVQWSRRFSGLRFFLNLSVAGWKGYAEHVGRAVKAADLIRDQMITRGWRVLNDSPLAVVCMVPPHGSPACRTIVERVLETGRAWVSTATFEGQQVIRACVTHGQTSLADIEALAAALASAACTAEN